MCLVTASTVESGVEEYFDNIVDGLLQRFSDIRTFRQRNCLNELLKFTPVKIDIESAKLTPVETNMAVAFRGTFFTMLISFMYYLSNATSQDAVGRLGKIGREELIERLQELRRIAKKELSGMNERASLGEPPEAVVTLEDGRYKLPEIHFRQSDALHGVVEEPSWTNVSRNAPCPCGSGEKYKRCHGRIT